MSRKTHGLYRRSGRWHIDEQIKGYGPSAFTRGWRFARRSQSATRPQVRGCHDRLLGPRARQDHRVRGEAVRRHTYDTVEPVIVAEDKLMSPGVKRAG
jgi:hypothetical protein